MGKFSRLIKSCFKGCQVKCESVAQEPVQDGEDLKLKAAGGMTKRPPVFPKTQTKMDNPNLENRPLSPFESRLRRLGKKIEVEVHKDDVGTQVAREGSRRGMRTDGEHILSNVSWNYLNTTHFQGTTFDYHSSTDLEMDAGVNKRNCRKPGYASIDSSEPESCTRLEEEEDLISSNLPWHYSTKSCASTASLRDITSTQYLFYEDEEDVVMEFFPSLRVIQQAS